MGVLHLPGGNTFYGRSYVSPTRVTGREEGTIRGIRSEIWEDDGSTEFTDIYERVQREGTFRAD